MLRLILALFLLSFPAMAEELSSSPVKKEIATATLLAQSETVAPARTFWVAVHLDMPADWHTYWINPGDTGLAAIVTPEELPEGVVLGPIQWQVPDRFEVAGLINYGYHDETLLLMTLYVPESYTAPTVPLTVRADWLVCKDICIPENATLSLEIPVGEESAPSERFARAVETAPAILKDVGKYNFDERGLWVEAPVASHHVADLFFLTEAMATTAHATLFPAKEATLLSFERGPSPHKDGLEALIVYKDGGGVQFSASYDATLPKPVINTAPAPAAINDITLPLALALAFLGGLILNAMPCVLPVLSLKLLGLVKKAGISRRAAAVQGIAYTAGILASFLAVAAALILLKQGDSALGWGFQLQSPVFVLGLAAVMFAVGLNLSGVFTVPGILGNLGQKSAAQETAVGSFLTGVLATLVATPCTAPFMASAIGFALTLPSLDALLIFAALGLGLAFPYLLVSLFPALRSWLPKPGAWMETFKQVLAFPMYATAAWLLWVLSTQTGPDALAIALALLLLIGFLAWAGQHATTRPRKLLLLALLFLLGGWLLAEVRYVENAPVIVEEHEAFSVERLEELRAMGKPVFVNATANWCITCKVNERVALSSPRVEEHFRDAGITVLVADWTRRDAIIGDYLTSLGRSGVPTYVYYPPQGDPALLPQLLTPESVVTATSPHP